MMDGKTIEQYSDAQLQGIISTANDLLKRGGYNDADLHGLGDKVTDLLKWRVEKRQAETLELIAKREAEHEAWKRSLREKAGLPPDDAAPAKRRGEKRSNKDKKGAFKPKSTHWYGHPDHLNEREYIFSGRGPKDKNTKWQEMISAGIRPVDLGTAEPEAHKAQGGKLVDLGPVKKAG